MNLQDLDLGQNGFCPIADYATWAINTDYQGSDCDQCNSFTCQNGGNCTAEPSTFNCTCSPGYFGVNCESQLTFISSFLLSL